MTDRRAEGGRATGWLLVLLLLLGLGGWNYSRNLETESQTPRPFRSYTDANLEQLLAAYEAEVLSLEERYQAAKVRAGNARDTDFIDEQIEEFERVQEGAAQVRKLGAELSERDAAIRQLRDELRLREEQGDALRLHLRRLLTIRSC